MDDIPISPMPKRYKAQKKPLFAKWWLWAIVAAIFIPALMYFMGVFGTPFTQKSSNDTRKAIDLSGLTVKEACRKARENGWQNIYVTVWASGSDWRQSDCDSALGVQDYELDSGYCWGVNMSSSTKHNLCIKAYENGYTGLDEDSNSESNGTDDGISNSDKEDISTSESNTQPSPMPSSPAPDTTTPNDSGASDSFRKAMDDYESFMNRYIDFMVKYENSSDTSSMLSDYSKIMREYAKYAESIQNYTQDSLSTEDWLYYLDVISRVNKRLMEVQ